MELNKTADEFRKAQEERITLIDQWKSTIEQMERRDDEMNDLSIVRKIFSTHTLIQ